MQDNTWDDIVAKKLYNDWSTRDDGGRSLITFNTASSLGNKFLDLGCGTGRFFGWLKLTRPDWFRYIGFDKSKAMLKIAKEQFPEAIFVVHDLLKPFKIGFKTEIVLIRDVLIHLYPEQQTQVLENVSALDSQNVVMTLQCGNNPKIERVPFEGRMFVNIVQDLDEFMDKAVGILKLNIKVVKTMPLVKDIKYTILHLGI